LLEKVILREIEDKTKISKNQFAYKKYISTVDALHELTNVINLRLGRNEVTVGTFGDIHGAFDEPKFERIKLKMQERGIPHIICNCYDNMNRNRILHANYAEEVINFKATCGFAQGGILSPMIWDVYVNDLVEKLSEIPDIEAFFYSDDFSLICKSNTIAQIRNKMGLAYKIK
jgi:hypothetical protein